MIVGDVMQINREDYIIERQNLTQKDVADITGILPYNLARFETGTRIPTLVVLEKYASALDKHIEIKLCDNAKK